MTTPAKVRSILKKHKLPFDISKVEGCWYVTGEETHLWNATSLNTFSFHGLSAEEWVDDICDIAFKNRDEVLRILDRDEEQAEWKAAVQESIKAVDEYLRWRKVWRDIRANIG
jgi:hypothetical protein